MKESEIAQSCLTLFPTPWTVACQAPPSMGFSRQKYWSELPFLSPNEEPFQGLGPPEEIRMALRKMLLLVDGSFIPQDVAYDHHGSPSDFVLTLLPFKATFILICETLATSFFSLSFLS